MKMICMIDKMKEAERRVGNTYFNMDEYRRLRSNYIQQLNSEIVEARQQLTFSPSVQMNQVHQMGRACNLRFFEMMETLIPVIEARFDDLLTIDEDISGFYAGAGKPKEDLYLVRNVIRVVMPRFVQGIEQVAHQNYMSVLKHALGANVSPMQSRELEVFAEAQTSQFTERSSPILSVFLQQAIQAIWLESIFNDMIESSVRNVRVSLN